MAYSYQRYRPGGGGLPLVVQNLLIANAVAFVAQMLFSAQQGIGPVENWFALWPLGIPESTTERYGLVGFMPWQLLTYGFLHGGFFHIFVNLYGIFLFGSAVEQTWGTQRFLFYYITCVVGAGIVQLIVTSTSGSSAPTLGASGGLFGLLLAFGMMFPRQQIMLLIPPVALEARWLVIIYGAVELWAGFSGTRTGVAHFAHLGGMLFGLVLILYWRGKLPVKPKWPARW